MKIKCSKCNYINDLNKNEYKEVKRKELGNIKIAGCVKCGTILNSNNEIKEEHNEEKDIC